MEYLRSAGLDSDPWQHQVLYDVFEPHGREYSPALSDAQKQVYRHRLAARLFERMNVRAPDGAAAEHAEEIWRLLGPASLALFPEVADVLRSLKEAGVKTAVISNWQCGLSHFCAELGIGALLDQVLASAEVGVAKPDPAIFAEACRRLGTHPGETLHVGDTPSDDLDGAQSAGLQALLIQLDAGGKAPTASSIRNLDEIMDVIDRAIAT